MAIVDTSFLVALTDRRDRFHEEARATPLVGDRFLVPFEVWVEYAQTILRRLEPPLAESVLRDILAGPFIVQKVTEPEDHADFVSVAGPAQARLRAGGRRPLSFIDLVVCQLAKRYHESILTFDEGIKFAVQSRLFPGARLH